jgi:RNA polymerase sigma-70 factor (sigma-E family)
VNFESWARSSLGGMLRFAMVLSCDRGLAEDVVQDVLVNVHRHWDRISGLDNPEAYVRRMIVNQYLSWRRKWARYVPVAELGEHDTHAAEPDHATQHADRAELIAELAKLPPKQRAVIALRYFSGLSDAEIAETLSCRPVTVRSQASRALATLRIEMRATNDDNSYDGAGHAY